MQSKGAFKDMMANLERKAIIEELENCHGNMAKAARALGITERMMGTRVAKYEIDPTQFK